MKKKVLKLMAALVAFLLISAVLSFTTSFVGNPISKMLANRDVQAYVSEKYADLDLEIESAIYNFKYGQYMSHVYSEESQDTHFSIFWEKGEIVSDDYEDRVLSGLNTHERLNQAYREVVEPLIIDHLPYEFDMVIASLNKYGQFDFSDLPLDVEFDLYNDSLDAHLTVYLYTDEMSWDYLARVAIEIDDLIQQNQLHINRYDIILEPTSAKEGKGGDMLGIYDFPQTLLKSENLAQVMKDHHVKWEQEMNQLKDEEANLME